MTNIDVSYGDDIVENLSICTKLQSTDFESEIMMKCYCERKKNDGENGDENSTFRQPDFCLEWKPNYYQSLHCDYEYNPEKL